MNILDQAIQATNNTPIVNAPALNLVESTKEVRKDYQNEDQKLFNVESHPLVSEYGTIPRKKGLFVDRKNINIVSGNYEIHQPVEIVEQFQKAGNECGFNLNRIVTNPNKGALLLSGSFPGIKLLGDDHDVNLTMYTSHCGKYKTVVCLDLLRIACMNQIPTICANKKRQIISEKHYKGALEISRLGPKLEAIPKMIQAYNERAEILSQSALSFDSFIDLFKQHDKSLKEESKLFDTKIEKLRQTYYNAPGQRQLSNGTAYKAFQAVTYANSHSVENGGSVRNTQNAMETTYHKNMNDSLVFEELLLEQAC